MTAAVKTIKLLAGDALIAAGELVRGRKVRFDGIEPADYTADPNFQAHTAYYGWTAPKPLEEYEPAAMECDGPMLSWPEPPPVTQADVRQALDETSDATLFGICATIIEGWKPILFKSNAGIEASVDVDVLVQALRDRRDQFAAVERDVDEPFHRHINLDEHLDYPVDSTTRHCCGGIGRHVAGCPIASPQPRG